LRKKPDPIKEDTLALLENLARRQVHPTRQEIAGVNDVDEIFHKHLDSVSRQLKCIVLPTAVEFLDLRRV
jgi:hypothetical protein